MNERRLLYIIGVPGVGKSTILAEALRDTPIIGHFGKPIPHVAYSSGGQLGVLRDKFSGTDGMSMSIQPKVLSFLAGCSWDAAVAEGDRLANGKFFEDVIEQGWRLEIIVVKAPWSVVEARRRERDGGFGAQDPRWLLSRETKIRRLTARWHPTVLEASGPPSEAARFLSDLMTMRLLRSESGGVELEAAETTGRLV